MLTAPFDFDPQTRVQFGPGLLKELGTRARELGRHALLVTDAGLRDAGHEQRAIDILAAADVEVSQYHDVRSNPTTDDIQAGVEFARTRPVDLIIGLGGGSSMDCAKGINFLLTNGGRMQDYKGTGKAKRPMLPLIAVPTTAGTGSEAQSYAVISDAQTHMKMACGDKKALARVAILDPELTRTMPRSVTAATGIDALSHALETFVTTRRNPVSEMFSRQAWQLLSGALPRVLLQPDDQEARGAMLLGAHFAGAAIENSMLGATHALANPLSAEFDLTHGIAIGALLPWVVRYNAQDPIVHDAYLQLFGLHSETSGRHESIDEVVHELTELIRHAGQPVTLKECEVDESVLPKLAEQAAAQWTAQFNPRRVDPSSLLEIYRCAYHGTVESS